MKNRSLGFGREQAREGPGGWGGRKGITKNKVLDETHNSAH